MRIGEHRPPRCIAGGRGAGRGGCQCGFTYLWLLFAVAIAGAGLAVAGQGWHQVAQREREQELLFRGREIAAAIGSYHAFGGDVAEPVDGDGATFLAELVSDDRAPRPVHHLRRLYSDPFTGQPDWVLVRDASRRVIGVRSRSNASAFITADLESTAHRGAWRVSDRLFVAMPIAASAPKPAASGLTTNTQ